jgi:hypothetical protein
LLSTVRTPRSAFRRNGYGRQQKFARRIIFGQLRQERRQILGLGQQHAGRYAGTARRSGPSEPQERQRLLELQVWLGFVRFGLFGFGLFALRFFGLRLLGFRLRFFGLWFGLVGRVILGHPGRHASTACRGRASKPQERRRILGFGFLGFGLLGLLGFGVALLGFGLQIGRKLGLEVTAAACPVS